VAPSPELGEAINSALAANIRKLRFEPPQKDGRAVSAVTYVRQDACAAPDGAGFRLAVRYRGNGPSSSGSPPPMIPHGVGHGRNFQATYQVTFQVDAGGSAHLESVALASGQRDSKKELEQAISDWVAGMHYQTEQLDGQPVATRISYPIKFMVGAPHTVPSIAVERRRAAAADAERHLAQAASNSSCEAAIAGRDKDERQVALDSPIRVLASSDEGVGTPAL